MRFPDHCCVRAIYVSGQQITKKVNGLTNTDQPVTNEIAS